MVERNDDAPIIILRGVHKWFGQFHVLRDLNLDVWKGQKVVVCGPSGSTRDRIACWNRRRAHARDARAIRSRSADCRLP